MAKPDPSVYVIDDDAVLCEAIALLLESMQIVAKTYSTAKAFLEDYNPQYCGCILMDIRLPIMGGFELLEELQQRLNRMPIIIITGHGDVSMAVRAMQAGAVDFILKPFNHQLLLEKVQKALAKDQQRHLAGWSDQFLKRLELLTSREKEILKFIVDGKLNKQIASKLEISLSTVEFHRTNLMRKLKVKTIAELVKAYLINSTIS